MRMNFSQKLVFAYTCIVVIPLFILVITAMGLIRSSRVDELEANSEGLLQENYEIVQKNIESFSLFEKIINQLVPNTYLIVAPIMRQSTKIVK